MTTVNVQHSSKNSLKISINGCRTDSAPVSEYVAKSMLSRASGAFDVSIDHNVQVPIGIGLGASGAGALSLALSLNEALGLSMSKEEAAQVAHIAEVECKTGLGTVIAETYGGMEIRVKAGAPGVGEIEKIPLGDRYVLVFLPFGPISTRKILTNELFRRRINDLGASYVERLLSEPEPEEFMRLSRSFAEHVGLITERIKAVLEDADQLGIQCSMPMFGEAVFSLVQRDKAEEVIEVFKRHETMGLMVSETGEHMSSLIMTDIDEKGARLV